jgi:hypothetical protein
MTKTKIIFFLLLFLIVHNRCYSKIPIPYIPLVHQHLIGLDLAQINYYTAQENLYLNIGVNYQYRPVRFLSLNSSLIFNDMNKFVSNEYENLYDYKSKGICFKYGYDVSLGLSNDKKTRLFIGQQFGILNYSESGNVILREFGQRDNYYQQNFSKKHQTSYGSELILGLKTNINKTFLLFQMYFMTEKSDKRVSSRDEIAYGYQSVFLPGYGFKRHGLNLIIGF